MLLEEARSSIIDLFCKRECHPLNMPSSKGHYENQQELAGLLDTPSSPTPFISFKLKERLNLVNNG